VQTLVLHVSFQVACQKRKCCQNCGVRILNPDEKAITEAAEALRNGLLVAFPTETVYGLGAAASRPEAISRLYAAKGRPANHPVIIHLAEREQLAEWASSVPEGAWRLAERLMPGPLTLILPASSRVPRSITGGQETVGLRIPNHPVAHRLLKAFGDGVAAPSANKFGRVSPTTAQDVATDFVDELEIVLDGGPCEVGIESTIVEFGAEGTARILRPGMIHAIQIAEIVGGRVDTAFGGAVKAGDTRVPGALRSHYAPNTPVLLLPTAVLRAEIARLVNDRKRVAVLAFAHQAESSICVVAKSTPAEYAQQLYANLRKLDGEKADLIVVEAVPETEEWAGIADRLRRASAEHQFHEGGTVK
jgi:L-threonylcarbamoyladenylate synthase